MNRFIVRVFALLTFTVVFFAAFCAAPAAVAQGSRKDDVVFNAQGRPMAGATVRVCTSAATGQPCSPLASIFSDPALTQALANPISTDGLGNYTFYAAPGRYEVEISGPNITTKQLPNVILPNDPASPTFTTVTTTSGITAFSLSLSGNLTVAGSAAVTGSLSVGGAPVPSTTQENQWTASQRFKGPGPWRDFSSYMPAGGCAQTNNNFWAETTGTITGGTNSLTVASAADFKNGCGIAVLHAGPTSTLVTPAPTATVSSASRSGTTVTITTVSNNGLAGAISWNIGVTVSGCSVSAYNGTFLIAYTDTTHFNYTAPSSGNDTATGCSYSTIFGYAHGQVGTGTTYTYKAVTIDINMGYSAASPAVSIVNGSLGQDAVHGPFSYNWVAIPFDGNSVMTAWYVSTNGGVSYVCEGTSFNWSFVDFGFQQPCPAFLPATPPASAGNQTLNTVIASGAGTTTLILGANATNTATAQNVYHDETSFLNQCVQDAINDTAPAGTGGFAGGTAGCFIPPGPGPWNFNAAMPTATIAPNGRQSTIKILLAGEARFSLFPWQVFYAGYDIGGTGGGAGGGSSGRTGSLAGIYVDPSVPAGFEIAGRPGGGGSASHTYLHNLAIGNYNAGHGVWIGQNNPNTGPAAVSVRNMDIETGSANAGSPIVIDGLVVGGTIADSVLVAGSSATNSDPEIWITATSYAGAGSGSCCFDIFNISGEFHGIRIDSPGGVGGSQIAGSSVFRDFINENESAYDLGFIQFDSGPNAPNGSSGQLSTTSFRFDNLINSDTGILSFLGILGAHGPNAIQGLENVASNLMYACGPASTVCAFGMNPFIFVQTYGQNVPSNPGCLNVNQNQGVVVAGCGAFFVEPLSAQSGNAPNARVFAQAVPAPYLSINGTDTSSSLPAGNYCAIITGLDALGNETDIVPTSALSGGTTLAGSLCQQVNGTNNNGITYTINEGGAGHAHAGIFTGFNFYFCNTGPNCIPNQKLSGLPANASGTSYSTYHFTSTSGAVGVAANQLPTSNLTSVSWLFNDQGGSCFYCTGSASDYWPVGFGVQPTAGQGINIQTAKGIRAGTQMQFSETAAPSGVAGIDSIYADSTAHALKASYNNGPFGQIAQAGSSICPAQGPLASVTGTGGLATYYTCTIPAGALAAGKGIRVTAISKHTTGTASVTYQLSFGGTLTSAVGPSGAANQLDKNVYEIFNAPGSTSSQTIFTTGQDSNAGTNSLKLDTASVNTASSVTLNVQFNVPNTDAITPEMFWVELIQ
jgi:hypothetical protein